MIVDESMRLEEIVERNMDLLYDSEVKCIDR
jgi:hypothetical protein